VDTEGFGEVIKEYVGSSLMLIEGRNKNGNSNKVDKREAS
jgi:hypothetical protein